LVEVFLSVGLFLVVLVRVQVPVQVLVRVPVRVPVREQVPEREQVREHFLLLNLLFFLHHLFQNLPYLRLFLFLHHPYQFHLWFVQLSTLLYDLFFS
jgi:hypothetical protein